MARNWPATMVTHQRAEPVVGERSGTPGLGSGGLAELNSVRRWSRKREVEASAPGTVLAADAHATTVADNWRWFQRIAAPFEVWS
jgi:hypothetical protein